MAISIDTVYQRVLALANKEQRGYITPQEFNLHANQAQMDIFDQYFYDLAAMNATVARDDEKKVSPSSSVNEPDFGDPVGIIRAKIELFQTADQALATPANVNTGWKLPIASSSIYRTGRLFYTGSTGPRTPLKRVDYYDLSTIQDLYNARTRGYHNYQSPTTEFYYTENADGTFSLYAQTLATVAIIAAGSLSCEIVVKPTTVKWGYVVVNEDALYDSSTSVDFELHQSEETNLVIKILELAGITINKPGLVQIASNEEKQNIEQTQ